MWEKIEKLCKKHKISLWQLSRNCGIPYTCFMDYKSGKSKPKIDKLQKLADFFGVPLEELIC